MRLDAEQRKIQILRAATMLAVSGNYNTITRESIARVIGCTEPLVTHYFGSIANLKRVVLDNAIDCRNNTILQQAIVNKDEGLADVDRDVLVAAVEAIIV